MPEAPPPPSPLQALIDNLSRPPSASLKACFALIGLMLALALLSPWVFDALRLDKLQLSQGHYWQLLTANLVHYGWLHTSLNLLALLVAGYALLQDYSLLRLLLLVLGTTLAVGLGMWLLDKDYAQYAGFSGAMHGLVLAGIINTRAHPLWLRLAALAVVVFKLVEEQSPGYEPSALHAWLPVPVAVNAHVYGACAGALIALGYEVIDRLNKAKGA